MHNGETRSVLPYSALVLTILLWASSFVGIRYALFYFTPLGLAVIRYVVAFVVLSIYLHRLSPGARFGRRDVFLFLVFGLLGVVGYHLGLNVGEERVSAATASFLVAQIPIATLIINSVLQRRLPKVGALLGVAVGILGTVIILLSQQSQVGFGLGAAFIIFAVFSESTYFVLQPLAFERFSVFQVNYYTTAAGAFLMLPLLADMRTQQHMQSAVPWLVAVYLGVFPAALAYLLWSYAIEKLGAVATTSSLYALPLVTLGVGYFILGELPVAGTVVGGLVALLGAYLVHKSKR